MQKILARAKIGFLILTLASVSSLGSQLFLLQSVAWARMFVHFSHHNSAPEALTKTFDGRHPCSLCKEISRANQDLGSAKLFLEKAENRAYLNESWTVSHFYQEIRLFSSSDIVWNSRRNSPPLQPPRA